MDLAVAAANLQAPEHLSLHHPELLKKIYNAGTVFLGVNTPESAGDYAAGPSHVLPTGGAARLRGGLSAADFVKVISVQELSAGALAELAPTITTLARAEGLEAHARAVEVRQALHGELDAGEGIAGTAAEIMHDKVNVQARLQLHVLQQPSISHFGFALAANENQPALGNEWKTPAYHPMVGTPP